MVLVIWIFKTTCNIQPIGPLQAVTQGTLLMVAKLAGTTLPCLPVRDGFCQGLILHVMPSDHPYSCTCLGHDSIPSKAMVEILEHKVFYVLEKYAVFIILDFRI
jgi:hypothetical protein